MQIKFEGKPEMMPRASTFASLFTELAAARTRFPTNDNIVKTLIREYQDMLGAMVDNVFSTNLIRYMALIKVMVMCVRLLEEGDSEFSYHPPDDSIDDLLPQMIEEGNKN